MAKESNGRADVGVRSEDTNTIKAQADQAVLAQQALEAELLKQKQAEEALLAKKEEEEEAVEGGQEAAPAEHAEAAPADAELTSVFADAAEGAQNVMVAQAGNTASDAGGAADGGWGLGTWVAIGAGATAAVAFALAGDDDDDKNAAPVASNVTLTTQEDVAGFNGQLPAVDDDGDVLTYTIDQGPTAAQGTLNVNPDGSFTFIPEPNFNGTVTINFTVEDPSGATSSGVLTINVTAVNDVPTAINGTGTGTEDAAITGSLAPLVNDVDGDTLTYSLNSQASNGMVSINSATGAYTYTPNANFNGNDSFTFAVSDGNGGVVTATVNLTVTPVNDAPVASALTVNATEDQVLNGTLPAATDVDGDTVTYALNTGAANGTVTVNGNGSFIYVPNANFNGTDTFTYTVSDGNGGSNTYTVTVNVANVNDVPVGANGAATTAEDVVLNGNLPAATDLDGDTLTYALATGPANGTVVVNANGSYTYTPVANFNGNDSFTFTVSDGNGGVVTYTQSITVTAVNDAPVAQAQTLPAIEDTVLNGSVSATDVDGDALTFSVVGGGVTAQGGQVVMQPSGLFTYTPALGFSGSDSFTYTVSDGNGGSDTAVITLNVQEVDEVFTAGVDIFNGNANDEVFIGANANLNAGDSVNGNGGFDIVTHSVDAGLLNVFSGFIFNNVDRFDITSDSPQAATSTYDLSSSGPIGILRVQNSTDNVVLNSAGAGALVANTTFLEIFDQTSTTTNVSLDIRDIDVAGNNDFVDVTVRSATNAGDALDDLNIDFAVETVTIHTDGPLPVVINDLNTDLGGAAGSGAVNLVLDAQDSSLAITLALTANVKNVDGDSSTQNLSFTLADANGNTTVTTGSGNDNVTGSAFADNITTNEGADSVAAGTGNDTVVSGGGNDSVAGQAGNDSINGGLGNDNLDGGADNDNIDGGEGNDVITDGTGNDTVLGGAGNDTVNLDVGADRIDTGADNDIVNAGANLTVADTVTGGAGNDILNILTDNTTSDLNNVTQVERIVLQDDGGPYSYSIGNVSAFDNDGTIVTVDGSALDAGGVETLTFDASTLSRGIILIGGGSGDTLTGGSSTDTLLGGLGNDVLTGNNGNDTFVVRGNGEQTAGDTVSGGGGTDTLLALKDNIGGSNETFVLDAGVTSVEQLNVRNQAFNNSAFNPDHLTDVARNNGTVNITFNAGYNNGTTMTVDAQDSNNGLASNQVLVLDASANGVGENLIVRSGAGNDSLSFGLGVDQVFGNDGNDTINMNGGLTALDIVDGGNSTANAVPVGNPGNGAQSTGNELQVNAGTADASYTNVSNIQTLTVTTTGTTTLGQEAYESGIRLVNLNLGGGNDVLDASNFNNGDTNTANDDGLIVNDFGGNDSIATSNGTDTVNMGGGSDSLALGGGDDTVYTQGNELDITDSIAGGAAAETNTVLMDNSTGAVTAVVNLTNVTDIDNYAFTHSGDRLPGLNDFDNNTLTFTGGNVGTVNVINIDASANATQIGGAAGLADPQDTFTVTLAAGQTDADFQFLFTGSATDDTFIKQNTAIQNTVVFTGGAGNDTLEMDGDAQGANITFNGDGLGAPSNALTQAVALQNAINGNNVGDTVRSSGGAWIDNDFTNISNVEILTANPGTPLNAILGAFAASSGVNVIVGSNVNDNVVFNPAFGNNLVVDLSNGGNDTINAGAIGASVLFVGDAADFDVNDALTGGTSSGDAVHIRNNGAADLTTMTNVELVKIERTVNGGDPTVTLDTTLADLNGVNFLTVDATELLSNENFTLNGQTATAALSVTSGAGNDVLRGGTAGDTIIGGAGNDSINGGLGGDVLDGGSGNDIIITGAASASQGDGAADTVLAGTGADTVVSGTGGDRIDLGVDNNADAVFIEPAAFNGMTVTPVLGVPEITNFDPTDGDSIRISNVLLADGTTTLAPGANAVVMALGDSWRDGPNGNFGTGGDDYAELVVISTVANSVNAPLGITTGVGVADFLDLNDLASGNNGQKGVFALTDGTDTYLWLYTDDGDSNITGTDFTLLAVLRGATGLTGANLQLSAGAFTPFDDNVLVLDGSTVDGLAGQDSITLVDNGTDGAVVQVTNIETVNGTAGNDTVTFVGAPTQVELFSNGGTDNAILVDGQTLVLHSNANVTVAGDVANTVDTLVLANDGVPHNVRLQGIDLVTGSNGNDTITFLSNGNQPVAGATVNGGAGNDTVNGANGGQLITLTSVAQFNGGTGNDTINSDSSNGTINGGAGAADRVIGTAADDSLTVATVESVVSGGGSDTITLADNTAISIDGGADSDTVQGSVAGDNITVINNSVESIVGNGGNDTVNGTGANDTLTVATVEQVNTGDGNNQVNLTDATVVSVTGGTGQDTVSASVANDTISFSQVESVNSGAGNDTLNESAFFNGTIAIDSGDGDDDLVLTSDANLTLGAGNDGVTNNGFGGLTFMTVNGGAGTDVVQGNQAMTANVTEVESVVGSGAADTISVLDATAVTAATGADNDTVSFTGPTGNGSVAGGAGNDSVVGSAGVDALTVSTVESVNTGAGDDQLTVADSTAITVDLGSGNDAASFSAAANGTIVGNDGLDTVTGTAGNDLLSVSTVESVDVGAGSDSVTVTDSTAIVMDLGLGDDTASFGPAAANATINGNAGTDTVQSGAGADVLQVEDVNSVSTGAASDTVTVTDGTPVNIDLGTESDQVLFTAAGFATVTGGAGTDTVTGSTGGDILSVNTLEILNTGNGNDVVSVTDANGLTANLGAGNDALTFTVANATDSVDGGADSDTVTGSSAADTLTVTNVESVDGGAGTDIINVSGTLSVNGGADADTVNGSAGTDNITVTAVEEVNANAGNDSVTATDSLLGSANLGAGADVLTFQAAANATVDGGLDADTVIGSGNSDLLVLTAVESLQAGTGADTVTVTDSTSISANLGGGSDSILFTAAANATVDGGLDSDVVSGGTFNDFITVVGVESVSGDGGNDTIAVNDSTLVTISAGDGNDAIDLFDGANDNVTATGFATVDGGNGTDIMAGSFGNDLVSLTNVETFDAATGNDTVTADSSLVTVLLGGGDDVLTYTAAANATVDGGSGADTVTVSTGNVNDVFQLANVESVNSGNGSDTITFTAAAMATVNAGGGVDSVSGSSGNDTLTFDTNSVESADGGAGTDSLQFTGNGAQLITLAGFESINSGAGNDSITLSAANTAVVTIDAGAGNADAVSASGGADSLIVSGLENLSTGGGADNVTINDATPITVDLGGGNDELVFGVAPTNATIIGGAGNDTVTGTSAADVLTVDLQGGANDIVNLLGGNDLYTSQGAGNQSVNGGAGFDQYTSGAGASDTFVFTVGETASNTGTDADLISNFIAAEDDVAFTGGVAGTTGNYVEGTTADFAAAVQFAEGTGGFGAGVVYVFVETNDGNSYLFFDADNNGQLNPTGDAVVTFAGISSGAFSEADIVAG